jgi:hypothetical protein
MCQSPIANIDISKEYDESLGTDDVHYQSFARMAAFFGRDMQAHRHDQYFQMHFLDTGQIELSSTITAIRCRPRCLSSRRRRCRTRLSPNPTATDTC